MDLELDILESELGMRLVFLVDESADVEGRVIPNMAPGKGSLSYCTLCTV